MNNTETSDDSDDEVRVEKIILTTVFVALGIGGFVLSTLWSYSTHLTLKDAKTDQTKLIIKNLLYLFIIGILNTVLANGLVFVWVWSFYDFYSTGRTILIGVISTFLIAEPFALSVIAFNRFKSSSQVHNEFNNYSWILICVLSILTGVGTSILEWQIGINSGLMLPASISVIIYILTFFLSIKTHQNIVTRFPKEKSKSSKILGISSIGYLCFFGPFVTISFFGFFDNRGDLYFLSSILVTRLSSILNGFIYGWSNRRVQPNFHSLFKKKSSTPPKEVVGETNEAFSDQAF